MLGSARTLCIISEPLLIFQKPRDATSIIWGVSPFLCLMKCFSNSSTISSEPRPTLAKAQSMLAVCIRSKYLQSPSSTILCSMSSQNSLSYKYIPAPASMAMPSAGQVCLSRPASCFLTKGRISSQNSGDFSSFYMAMKWNPNIICLSVIYCPYFLQTKTMLSVFLEAESAKLISLKMKEQLSSKFV